MFKCYVNELIYDSFKGQVRTMLGTSKRYVSYFIKTLYAIFKWMSFFLLNALYFNYNIRKQKLFFQLQTKSKPNKVK